MWCCSEDPACHNQDPTPPSKEMNKYKNINLGFKKKTHKNVDEILTFR